MSESISELVDQVLQRGHVMSLGTNDDGGVWVSDVTYVFDEDFTIYWISKSDKRHSQAIETTPGVAGTITVSVAGEPNLGIQFSGQAKKIEGARYDLANKLYEKRRKPAPNETDDVLHGASWYELKLDRIELIDEAHFGFEKQTYHPSK